MKGVGMLVVSFRGINFGFWSHLGCSGQNAIIFSREGLVQGCTRKNITIYIVCVLTWSLLGVKKSLGPAQIGLLQGFNSKFSTSIPTPFIWGVPPGYKGSTQSSLQPFLSRHARGGALRDETKTAGSQTQTASSLSFSSDLVRGVHVRARERRETPFACLAFCSTTVYRKKRDCSQSKVDQAMRPFPSSSPSLALLACLQLLRFSLAPCSLP